MVNFGVHKVIFITIKALQVGNERKNSDISIYIYYIFITVSSNLPSYSKARRDVEL